MNFNNKFDTYNENAHIQKKVAAKLMNLVPKKNYDSIFEIGCGTGILSRKISKNIPFKKFIINDKFPICKNYINDIHYSKFLVGDISNLQIPQSDLIISSSVFQWINDKESLFKKISNSSSTLIFSIYIDNNLKEISDHFGVSLDYNSVEELKNMLTPYFSNIFSLEEKFILNFDTPLEGLSHLKNTGVTGFKRSSISQIRSYSSTKLTYHVAYFVCQQLV